jgi:hypothetical protein
MGYKRFETDQRVIVSVADLLQDRLENITYKPGHGSRTITSDGGTSGCTTVITEYVGILRS